MGTTQSGSTIFTLCVVVASLKVISAAQYSYLGCFKDSAAYPDLSGSSTTMVNMTVESCVQNCKSQGYPYAGLQQGTKCMCGDTYNQRGTSTDCTTCTSPSRCGGVLANDVYYTPDSSLTGRVPVANSLSTSFTLSRRACIKSNGDLIAPSSQQVIDSIVQLWTGMGQTAVWVGLWKKTNISLVYSWADETISPTYQDSNYASYWTAGDAKDGLCVSLVIATSKLKSSSCDTALPYVCNQPSLNPASNSGDGASTDAPGSSDASKKKRLALFIVLPIFLFCYGGSCILYCVHKIIKNCTKRKHPAKVPIDQMENGNRYTDRPPRRPLSASRGRIFPMAPPVALDMPGKAMPTYIPQAGAIGGKTASEYKPGMDARPSSSSGVQIAVGGSNLLAPPPPYSDEKRAKLLENAARESRERRAKDEAEGKASPRPFSGAPKKEGLGEKESPRDPSPLSTGSTVNLLGARGTGLEDDEEDRLGNNSPMSINEILKRKVQEKKKSKRIVTT